MDKYKILFVEKENDTVEHSIFSSYNMEFVTEGILAISKIIWADYYDLILLNIKLTDMNGFEVLSVLASGGHTTKCPVIILDEEYILEHELRSFRLGADDYIVRSINELALFERMNRLILQNKKRRELLGIIKEREKQSINAQNRVIQVMTDIVENKNIETKEHFSRLKKIAYTLLKCISISGDLDTEMKNIDIETLSKAIALHDIGKILTPDNILLKPDKLSEAEYVITKEHTKRGAELFEKLNFLGDTLYNEYCKDICLYHHEHWDGTGYPFGKKEKDIPFGARVSSIIDVYDALTNNAIYKTAVSHDDAIEVIKSGCGKQFDPAIAEIFIQNHERFRE